MSVQRTRTLDRYHSFNRKLHKLMQFRLWGKKEHRKEHKAKHLHQQLHQLVQIRPVKRQCVLKVKGKPIDEVSLGIILERKAERARVRHHSGEQCLCAGLPPCGRIL